MQLRTIFLALSAIASASAQQRGVSLQVTDGRTLWVQDIDGKYHDLKTGDAPKHFHVAPDGSADGIMVLLEGPVGKFQVSLQSSPEL